MNWARWHLSPAYFLPGVDLDLGRGRKGGMQPLDFGEGAWGKGAKRCFSDSPRSLQHLDVS